MPSSTRQDTTVTATEQVRLDAPPARLWPLVADAVTQWARSRDVALRDVVVLLPSAQLLGPARQAWAQRLGWMPRIETTATLGAALVPAAAVTGGQLRLDPVLDNLAARALLARQAWMQDWASRDPGALALAAAQLASTARALARAAFALPPASRAEYWQRARAMFPPSSGVGRSEALLVRMAIEWAALADAPPTDALFSLQPGAWVVVRAGGGDPLTTSLVGRGDTRALVIETDPPSLDAVLADGQELRVASCDGFEDEAQVAAAQLLAHVRAGELPAALIAHDRELVRRVHALLVRRAVAVDDETGWRLSTSRAGALVMAWLRAARADASTDEVLDALLAAQTQGAHDPRLRTLETALRKSARARRGQVDCTRFDPASATLWREVQSGLDALSAASRAPLAAWNRRLQHLLDGRSPSSSAADADVAWLQVEQALHWHTPDADLPDERLNFGDYVDWVGSALEAGVFVPAALSEPARVVITPLARAMLRPFAAVVMPGCDDKRLGAMPPPHPLLGEAAARELGLPGTQELRLAELRAFTQVLRAPRLTLTWRRVDGDAPLAASPHLERLALAWQRRSGAALPAWIDPRIASVVEPAPSAPPAPVAHRLPERLSASHAEALRACPYRFFALAVLGLRQVDEFDDDPVKSDYGSWLHAVLYRFHSGGGDAPGRGSGDGGGDVDAQARALHAAADIECERLGLDEASFLPYAASFEAFVPLYLSWLRARRARGLTWREGEVSLALHAAQLGPIQLHGRIDRIDADLGARGGALELIDYKTGGVAALKAGLIDPREDTQLAFYAALVDAREAAAHPLRALYLALDDRHGIQEVEHPDVRADAQALLDGLGRDLEHLRQGAGMPALGEGEVCEYCEARGLCRRDDWARPTRGRAGA